MKKPIKIATAFCVAWLALVPCGLAQNQDPDDAISKADQSRSDDYPDFWNDATLSAKVDKEIERNRKSDVKIYVSNAVGKPLPQARVIVDQVDSSFHFGANIFMLGGYPTPELNRRYEDAFCKLFNGATVPFYWKDLEPEQGNVRFAFNSPFIARRPPPDAVVEFCEKNGLKMHGHPLVWKSPLFIPPWMPKDPGETSSLFEKRIHQIAERYGSRIHRWDAVNEVIAFEKSVVPGFPPDYAKLAFTWGSQSFPFGTRLDINETGRAWGKDGPAYYRLIERLLREKAPISGIGFQAHFFKSDGLYDIYSGGWITPEATLATLDKFAQFGLPIHISEITLPSPKNDSKGQYIQAQIVRSYYRLWFSHPAVDSITWWNVPDGGAAAGEDNLLSGLLTEDLQPKAAYQALYELIHNEWRTHTTGVTSKDGSFAFRGFHGRYKVRVEPSGGTRFFAVQPGVSNEVTLRLSDEKNPAF
jgi:endo-1,4-beta-xylanase